MCWIEVISIMRIVWWIFVLVIGILATIVGLILPLVPGLPWLFFVDLALTKLCPTWWHRQRIYQYWLEFRAKLHAKLARI